MIQHDKISDTSLDMTEQQLLESLEQDDWQTVPDVAEQTKLAREAAANYLRKDTRINIRISSSDLNSLKQRAAYKGLPYQTLISSILHEYAAGHFQEKI